VIEDHLWGCQFHPEKSSAPGIAFLTRFVEYVAAGQPARKALATK
jgi:imidazoleglycerol phosphate synthase glutamine amidotransferase subunit HisH